MHWRFGTLTCFIFRRYILKLIPIYFRERTSYISIHNEFKIKKQKLIYL